MNKFKLDNHPKMETGFKVPEDYFDTLSDKINTRLTLTKEPKIISFYKHQKKTIFTVAAILVLALSVPFFMSSPTKVSDLDQTVIENYITYNTKITTYELAEYLDAEDIEKLKVDFNIQDDELEESLLRSIDLEHYIIN